MSFQITGLDPAPFRPLFGLDDETLRRRAILRMTADEDSGFPDRISLRDAAPGETVLLLNHRHQPADTPFRASHAIFVRESAEQAFDAVDVVPEALRTRLLSIRAFDADHMMVDAEIVDGADLAPLASAWVRRQEIAYLQVHFAKWGCYAARIAKADRGFRTA